MTPSRQAVDCAAQLEAMVKLLGPDEMTPTAKRQLLALVEQWRES